MSVINRMLQDLERRRADAPAAGPGLAVRAVDAPVRKPWLLPVVILFLIATVAIAGWWFLGPIQRPHRVADSAGSAPTRVPVHVAPAHTMASTAPSDSSTLLESTSASHDTPLPAPALRKATPLPSSDSTPHVASGLSAPKGGLSPPIAVDHSNRTVTSNPEVPTPPTLAATPPSASIVVDQADRTLAPNSEVPAPPTIAPMPPYARPERSTAAPERSAVVPERPAAVPVPPAVVPERMLDTAQLQAMKQVSTAQRAEAAYQQALQFLQQERYSDAERALNEALRSDASHSLARQTLVGLLVEQKRLKDAEPILRDGLAINPAQRGFAMALARLQAERGDTQAALTTLRQSLPYSGDSADYRAFLAALYQRTGNSKDAIRQYDAALKLAPNNGAWWMGMGLSLEADGQNAAAQDAFRRALATNSLSPELQAFVSQHLKQLR